MVFESWISAEAAAAPAAKARPSIVSSVGPNGLNCEPGISVSVFGFHASTVPPARPTQRMSCTGSYARPPAFEAVLNCAVYVLVEGS